MVRSFVYALPSMAQRRAVTARVCATFQEAMLAIDAYRVRVPHVVVPIRHHLHRLTTTLQLANHLIVYPAFEREVARRRSPRSAHQPARRLNGLLDVVTKVDKTGHQRRLRLWLALTAHRTECEIRFSVTHHHSGYQGVEGAF